LLGPTIGNMSVDGRMVLCNMAVEMGAKTGIIEPDETTINYVKSRTKEPFKPVKSDSDATYKKVLDVDVTDLEPQVSCPHSVDNVKPISEVDKVEVDRPLSAHVLTGA